MKKIMSKYLVLLALLLLVSNLFCTKANAAVISEGYHETPVLCGFTDYGWATFTVTAIYSEYYSEYINYNTFTSRTKYLYVTCSRNDAPANVQMALVANHHTASGSILKSFSDFSDVATIIPSGFFAFSHKENVESISYPVTTTNYATNSVGISGGIYPWSGSISLPLGTA